MTDTDCVVGLDFDQPGPRHTWTYGQQVTICLMASYYEIDWISFAKVFNYMFAKEINTYDFPDGLSLSRLKAQWYDIKLRRPIWVDVGDPYFLSQITEVTLEIEISASSLQVVLSPKIADAKVLWPERRPGDRTTRVLPYCPKTPSPPSPPSSLIPPFLQRSCHQPVPSGNKRRKCIRCSKNTHQIPEELPSICFRVWTPASQGINSPTYFCAGEWASNQENVPRPSSYNQRDFDATARRHLSKDKTLSPFISLYDTPLPTIHRAVLWGGEAFVTFFDMTGFDPQRIFSAVDILCGNQLSAEVTGNLRYEGTSEWLIWGDIPQRHILQTISRATLESPPIDSLLQTKVLKNYKFNRRPLKRRLAASRVKADRQNGAIVGQFLAESGFSIEHAGDIAVRLAERCGFERSRDEYSAFLRGVNLAFAEKLGISSPLVSQQVSSAPLEALPQDPAIIAGLRSFLSTQDVIYIDSDEETESAQFGRNERTAAPKLDSAGKDVETYPSVVSDEDIDMEEIYHAVSSETPEAEVWLENVDTGNMSTAIADNDDNKSTHLQSPVEEDDGADCIIIGANPVPDKGVVTATRRLQQVECFVNGPALQGLHADESSLFDRFATERQRIDRVLRPQRTPLRSRRL